MQSHPCWSQCPKIFISLRPVFQQLDGFRGGVMICLRFHFFRNTGLQKPCKDPWVRYHSKSMLEDPEPQGQSLRTAPGQKPTNNILPKSCFPIPDNECWGRWSCCAEKDAGFQRKYWEADVHNQNLLLYKSFLTLALSVFLHPGSVGHLLDSWSSLL